MGTCHFLIDGNFGWKILSGMVPWCPWWPGDMQTVPWLGSSGCIISGSKLLAYNVIKLLTSQTSIGIIINWHGRCKQISILCYCICPIIPRHQHWYDSISDFNLTICVYSYCIDMLSKFHKNVCWFSLNKINSKRECGHIFTCSLMQI